jgi:hypothetical protein
MNMTGVWEGTLDGTNWGRLLIRLQERAGVLSGQAEITDIGVGAFTLDVAGRRDAQVSLHLKPNGYAVREYPGTLEAIVEYETDTLTRGSWRSSIGTYGTFRAQRHATPLEAVIAIDPTKLAEANAAFIIMAFSEQSRTGLPLPDIHASIKRGCDSVSIRAHRADEVEHSGSITDLILKQIRSHRFLISDLTHERPNVYYEIGYAHGMQKEVVLTAFSGTTLHFDIAAQNVIFYSSGTELEDRIARRLRARIENVEKLDV